MEAVHSIPLLDDREPITQNIAPIDPSLRIGELDAVRGGALIGVILMNLYEIVFNTVPPEIQKTFPTASLDKIVAQLDNWLILGKAQFLFGTLFGLGFAIFLDRGRRAERKVVLPYLRRLIFLFLIGIGNTFAVFFGDVLHSYAIVGLVAAIYLLPKRLLLVASAGLILFPATIADFLWFPGLARRLPSLPIPVAADAVWQAYSHYNAADLADASWKFVRAFELGKMGISKYANYAGQFLFGIWLFRSGVLENLLRHPDRLRRLATVIVPLGLLLSGLDTFFKADLGSFVVPAAMRLLHIAATVSLALGWAASVAWLCSDRNSGPLATALRAYGRMALTNYVVQSLLIVLLLSTAGLGLIWTAGATLVFPLGLAIAAAQAAFSVIWLRRYRFGPLEWYWRNVTYWSKQPLRR